MLTVLFSVTVLSTQTYILINVNERMVKHIILSTIETNMYFICWIDDKDKYN